MLVAFSDRIIGGIVSPALIPHDSVSSTASDTLAGSSTYEIRDNVSSLVLHVLPRYSLQAIVALGSPSYAVSCFNKPRLSVPSSYYPQSSFCSFPFLLPSLFPLPTFPLPSLDSSQLYVLVVRSGTVVVPCCFDLLLLLALFAAPYLFLFAVPCCSLLLSLVAVGSTLPLSPYPPLQQRSYLIGSTVIPTTRKVSFCRL